KPTAGSLVATSAPKSHRISSTSRAPQKWPSRLFRRAHLAVRAWSRRHLLSNIPPRRWSDAPSASRNLFTEPVAMFHQIHTYTELRRQIHDGLRLQHPEWVQPNGESPICDSYEARLMELLDALTRTNAKRTGELPTT